MNVLKAFVFLGALSVEMSNFMLEDYNAMLRFINAEISNKKLKLKKEKSVSLFSLIRDN